MLNFMMEYFNFTVEPLNCDMKFGNLVNGSWTGLVGQLIQKNANFCSHLSLTSARFQYIEYSLPYVYEPVTFMLNSKYSYLNPTAKTFFDGETSLFFSILVAFFLGFVLIGRQMQAAVRVDDEVNIFWTLSLNFLQKGLTETELPRSKTVRILVFTCLSFSLFVMAMIGGFVLSLLARAPLNMMDTLAKLEASPVLPTVVKGSFLINKMAETPNPLIQALSSKLVVSTEADVSVLQRQIIQGQRFALFQTKSELNCAKSKLNERLIYIPPETHGSTLSYEMLALGYPRHSALKPIFDPV
ncbi:hypothetical protein HDE_01651 [Halotydeus destructor]|nr:hypothetical protein HDE_01651 [Halotydeus destructor]